MNKRTEQILNETIEQAIDRIEQSGGTVTRNMLFSFDNDFDKAIDKVVQYMTKDDPTETAKKNRLTLIHGALSKLSSKK